MRPFMLLSAFLLFIFCYGCRKKNSTVTLPPSPITDTTLDIPVVVYPYTDLYRGTLRVGYDSITNYEFSIIHISSDAILLMSYGVINGCPGFASRYFNFRYAVNPSNLYRFVTYETYDRDRSDHKDDKMLRGTVEVRLKHLVISWRDAYITDFRVSAPVGGLQYDYCGGYYLGTLVE